MRGLVVLGQHLRRSEFEIHLADRAGEGEWHLVVGVVHRRARVGADVEGLVERQKDRSGMVDALVRDVLAMSALSPEATFVSALSMSALCQKQTLV